MTCCEGTPLPAGTGLSRRSLLLRAAGLGMAVYGAGALSPRAFEEGIAAAQAADGSGRILVSVFLAGGIDNLSLLAPTGHAAYAKLRPSLAVPERDGDKLKADPTLQWHPNAKGLRDLHNDGKLTVLPGVGYDDPDQSHFTSRHYWEVGQLDVSARIGWMGRFLDRYGATDNPLQGLSLDRTLAPALAPERVPVAAVGQPEEFGFYTDHIWDEDINAGMVEAFSRLGGIKTSDAALASARDASRMATTLYGQLAPVRGDDKPGGGYPESDDDFPARMASLARMIALGMPLKMVAVPANGAYDTHDSQAASLPDDIALLSQTLAAFQADLEQRGIADRVVTHVWSEFGRRAQQNGNGTDHGAGGVSLLMGTRASGKLVGEFPGIGKADLDADGNLRHSTDFRAVYKTLIEEWFQADAGGIVQGKFANLPLLK
jgi:uncharacterized protein (DUF1501 family)